MLVQVVYAFRLVITHFIALIIISASRLTLNMYSISEWHDNYCIRDSSWEETRQMDRQISLNIHAHMLVLLFVWAFYWQGVIHDIYHTLSFTQTCRCTWKYTVTALWCVFHQMIAFVISPRSEEGRVTRHFPEINMNDSNQSDLLGF